jgi:hypothetical protein
MLNGSVCGGFHVNGSRDAAGLGANRGHVARAENSGNGGAQNAPFGTCQRRVDIRPLGMQNGGSAREPGQDGSQEVTESYAPMHTPYDRTPLSQDRLTAKR